MHKVSILGLKGQVIENTFFMRQPSESDLNNIWVYAIKLYGPFIVFHYEPTKYAEM